jgi:hypothetical protein
MDRQLMSKKQFFIHVKKTAGTSLVSLIQRNYDWHSEIFYQASTWREIWRQDPQKLFQSKFIRGHFGINLLKLLPHNIDRFTFLRDPVQRCLSDLNFANRTKGHWPHKILSDNKLSAKEALFHPQINNYCKNHLLANLGMDVPIEYLWMNRPAIIKTAARFMDFINSADCLENAKNHLNDCYFIGITEYFTLSYLLLCYLNHWRPDLHTQAYHKGDKSWISETIGPEEIEYLNMINQNDLMLYEHAKKKFEEMVRHIFPDLMPRASLYTLDKKELNLVEDKIYELAMARYHSRLCNCPVQYEWQAAMPLFGCGWQDVHSPEASPHRWSGPGTFSELDVRLDGLYSCKMKILFRTVMAPDIEAHMQVSVNQQPVDYRILSPKRDGIQVEFIIDKEHQKYGFVSVGIHLPRTVSPAELDAKNSDTLKRGIAIDGYYISPA